MCGTYAFTRARMVGQQALNRLGVGNASAVEVAGIRAREAAARASSSLRGTGTGQKLQRMQERADRIGK